MDSRDQARRRAMYAERVARHDAAHPGYAVAWERLSAVLLALGGDAVVPPQQPDPMIDWVAAAGRIWDGTGAVLHLGAVSDCHRNAVELWRTGDAVAIGTGYALSDDELWREHSWAFGDDGVIETTAERTRYFGLRMEAERAEWFAEWIDPRVN